VIASGDQFINSAEKKAWISSTFGAIACEMEGAAIGQVCYVNGVEFAVLRTISDNASGDADIEFPEMARRAADMAQELLLRVLG
jgi:adenosylhomocysteine nucleosidase